MWCNRYSFISLLHLGPSSDLIFWFNNLAIFGWNAKNKSHAGEEGQIDVISTSEGRCRSKEIGDQLVGFFLLVLWQSCCKASQQCGKYSFKLQKLVVERNWAYYLHPHNRCWQENQSLITFIALSTDPPMFLETVAANMDYKGFELNKRQKSFCSFPALPSACFFQVVAVHAVETESSSYFHPCLYVFCTIQSDYCWLWNAYVAQE